MSEVNRRYFESLMSDKKLSLRALATKMGMNHSQLSLTFSGARKLQLDEAAQLSQIFGEPLFRIVENAGVTVRPTSGKRIPVIGAVNGDGTVTEHAPGVIERTSAPEDIGQDAIAFQCRTAGSELNWMDGFVFFCRPHNGVDPALLGRFCYCRIKGGPSVVAAVRRGYQEHTFNLSGPFTKESAVLEWATPIILTRN
jgi:transcriptional regulator with XRE-family HTH domain